VFTSGVLVFGMWEKQGSDILFPATVFFLISDEDKAPRL